jgi:hypothetical protein
VTPQESQSKNKDDEQSDGSTIIGNIIIEVAPSNLPVESTQHDMGMDCIDEDEQETMRQVKLRI